MDIVMPSGGSGGNLSGVANSAVITNGSSSVAVTFSSAFATTNYAIVANVRNTTDPNPIFLDIVDTVKSTSGFTATFNAPADSANYFVEYIAVGNV